jgi:hypothetical protein
MTLSTVPIRDNVFWPPDSGFRRLAIGVFPAVDFVAARQFMPDLANYEVYSDWLDTREGVQFGRVLAGEDVALVRVAASSFLLWCALEGVDPSEQALDAFAEVARAAREWGPPPAHIVALAPAPAMERFGAYPDEAANAASLPASARSAAFLDWCNCLNLAPSPAALDRYADLLLEQLTEAPIDPDCDSVDE